MYTMKRATSRMNVSEKRILHAHTCNELLLKKRDPKEKSKFAQILVFEDNSPVLNPEGRRGRIVPSTLLSLLYNKILFARRVIV